MTIQNYEIHEVAKRYPAMSSLEIEKMKESLKNEQRNPIYLYKQDDSLMIIDGRNRDKALRELINEGFELAYEPKYVEVDISETELEQFVDDLNMHRRHLTSSQRAVIARRRYLPLREKEATKRMQDGGKDKGSKKSEQAEEKGKAIEFAAKDANTNPDYVNRAGRIEEASSELFKLVEEGKINIMDASKVIKWDEDKKENVIQQLQEGKSFKDFVKKSKPAPKNEDEKPDITITAKYGIEIPEEIINKLKSICQGEVLVKNLKQSANAKKIEKVKKQMGQTESLHSDLENPAIF